MNIKLTWVCDICKDKVVSRSKYTHQMDTCKCGGSAIDLEDHYMRVIGEPRIIKREEDGKDS